MAHITVSVTHEDIESGAACEADACPVALALNRATGLQWTVGTVDASVGPFGEPVPLPEAAREFIRRLDRDTGFGGTALEIEPISFDMEIGDGILENTPSRFRRDRAGRVGVCQPIPATVFATQAGEAGSGAGSGRERMRLAAIWRSSWHDKDLGHQLSWHKTEQSAKSYLASIRCEAEGECEPTRIEKIEIPLSTDGLIAWLNRNFTSDNG